MKHFLSIADMTVGELQDILNNALALKKELQERGFHASQLKGKTLTMIFEKPSLRTRLSFEIGMKQLGGHAVYLGPSEIGLGKRETVHDIAKVVSSMSGIIMARVYSHGILEELAGYATVPVINALSDLEHPCQILADLLAIYEVKGKLQDLTVCFIGDCENNIVHSWVLASAMLGLAFRVACPPRHVMRRDVLAKAKKIAPDAKIIEYEDPKQAIADADVVITDTWVSMGDEAEKEERLRIFRPYQVNADLMRFAKKDAMFLHCLPAHRGEEVTSDVIDGPRSFVFQEAENRLHIQKALVVSLLKVSDVDNKFK